MFWWEQKVWRFPGWMSGPALHRTGHEQDGFYITISCIAECVSEQDFEHSFWYVEWDDFGSSKAVFWIKT